MSHRIYTPEFKDEAFYAPFYNNSSPPPLRLGPAKTV